MHNFNSPFPRGIESKFPGERGMKIRQIPRGIGDGDPRGGNPSFEVCKKYYSNVDFLKNGWNEDFNIHLSLKTAKFETDDFWNSLIEARVEIIYKPGLRLGRIRYLYNLEPFAN